MTSTQVSVIAEADGKTVRLDIIQDGKKISVPLPPKDIGTIAVGLLTAAVECGSKDESTARPFESGNDQAQFAYAFAKGVALRDTDRSDVLGMVFAFGGTELNLGLSRAAMKPLGTALLAATADSSRPQ